MEGQADQDVDLAASAPLSTDVGQCYLWVALIVWTRGKFNRWFITTPEYTEDTAILRGQVAFVARD
jgi:hypothetical protein